MLPDICPGDKLLPNIIISPDIAKIIEVSVILEIVSFRKTYQETTSIIRAYWF